EEVAQNKKRADGSKVISANKTCPLLCIFTPSQSNLPSSGIGYTQTPCFLEKMWSTAREIAAGDTTRDFIQPLVVTPGKDLNNKYGMYKHEDFIGLPYGSKVGSRTGRGFIHVLRPTPELWTLALPHRTQILYIADISLIVSYLDIRRGSRVIEAGTGSGSFSHSVARTIGPLGHLHSYEFHEARANKARRVLRRPSSVCLEEFSQHGMSEFVTLTHQNVCKDGFNLTDTVDSVFLDLPAPWDAIGHAKQAMRKDRAARICCFSPCMEQVLRTVSALNDAGFSEITMYETLVRTHDVSQVPVLQPISDVVEKLKRAEGIREVKRLKQVAAGQRSRENPHGEKRKRDQPAGEGSEPEDSGGKRLKTEEEMGGDDAAPDNDVSGNDVRLPVPPAKISVSKAMAEVRGHTSYLTFAVLLPAVPSAETPVE
ncbi:unnamed protein product, partial [Mycena citricolor]